MKQHVLFVFAFSLTMAFGFASGEEPSGQTASENKGEFFRNRIAPILQQHCLSCHNEENRKGRLSLQTGHFLSNRNELEAIIVPGKPNESYLLDLITPHKGKAEMPSGGKPLSMADRNAIRKWIEQGADWPKGFKIEKLKWWSLQPLKRPPVPANFTKEEQNGIRNPVDSFIRKKSREQKMTHASEADKRTLIRRVTFDLTGLPPTPEEIAKFLLDTQPNAYEKLVDRLLASPRYGERWGRHWLDVVHYGETHGYDKDKPRPNAWPYRDYVIRSFNEDKLYSRFIQEQIAGDVLYPETVDGIEALGFIAAGPWDFIGHAEVPETKIDGKIARHLDRDDMVQNTILTFCGLTVGCAQCHDHKFDPISMEDYYALQAVFAALDRADKEYFSDPRVHQRWLTLQQKEQDWKAKLSSIKKQISDQGGEELKKLEAEIAKAARSKSQRPPEYGYHSQIVKKQNVEKWVQVDLKKTTDIRKLVLIPCEDDFNNIGKGFGFPVRYQVEVSNKADFSRKVVVHDQTKEDVPSPEIEPLSVEVENVKARYVRITATKLALRQNDYIFAISELQVFNERNENVAIKGMVTALDSIEAPVRWRKQNLIDDRYPTSAESVKQRENLIQERTELLARKVNPALLQAEKQWQTELKTIQQERKKLPSPQRVYAGTVHHGSGNFRGTGASGGKPRPIHFLNRGDVTKPGQKMSAGALSCLDELSDLFATLHKNAETSEGAGRATLAKWLSHRDNPLTWRVIVNRIWHYHFGRGIVKTPNDFGMMGELPTHRDLLNWLAIEFRDGGNHLKRQSIKSLHRLIVTSAVYRQSSSPASSYAKIDGDNHFYWKWNRKRLEAEAIRDALLTVSGKMNFQMGGPSFQDFVIEKPQHSPHYLYEKHDPEDPKSHRRSVYRFLVRSQTQPFMTVMDCADPSIMVAKRNETNSPLQALTMMNNQLSLVMAKHFAERLQSHSKSLKDQIGYAFQLALGRLPDETETKLLMEYAKENGLENLCRLIFNMNEFVFVD